MTTAFTDSAALMGRALGADGFPFVTIEHPLASAATDELIRRGREAADRCIDLLTSG